ncbi:MAG: cysteine desulfurase [Bacillales bacterium]|jgi:cysteine desulfurase|nr:cysteine desulfurase [Bacillales bacterium]
MKRIYLDHAATTPMHPEVIETMSKLMGEIYGNPSSTHSFGREAKKLVDSTRRKIAAAIGAAPQEIVFTSGGTEGNNTAIFSAVRSMKDKGNHIITTQIEHHAVLNVCRQLEKQGFTVTYLPVDQNGFVSVEDVKNALKPETILVSIMYVNNEMGAIQPIQEIGEILADHQALFHVDGVQAFCKIPLNVEKLKVDFLSAASHKINGPKGVGFLYVKKGVPFFALQFGGDQERKRRAGTENTISIAGFGKAIEVYEKNLDLYTERNKNINQILREELEGIEHFINSPKEGAVPNILSVSFHDVCVQALLTNLDIVGLAVSSGSACSAGSHEPSHVLKAMFPDDEDRAQIVIRYSFGLGTTEEDARKAARKTIEIVKKL